MKEKRGAIAKTNPIQSTEISFESDKCALVTLKSTKGVVKFYRKYDFEYIRCRHRL